jgi:hypothetical protein
VCCIRRNHPRNSHRNEAVEGLRNALAHTSLVQTETQYRLVPRGCLCGQSLILREWDCRHLFLTDPDLSGQQLALFETRIWAHVLRALQWLRSR